MHTDTSGGSSDTAVKELAAGPIGRPSSSAQTAVMPEGNRPKARRSCSLDVIGTIPVVRASFSTSGVTCIGATV